MPALDQELLSGADCLALHDELAAALKGRNKRLFRSCPLVRSPAVPTNSGASTTGLRGWPTRWAAPPARPAKPWRITAGRPDCPGTRLALLEGVLSLGQAAEIVNQGPRRLVQKAELLKIARGSDCKPSSATRPRAPPSEHRRQRPPPPADARPALPLLARPPRHGLFPRCSPPPETGVPFANRLRAGSTTRDGTPSRNMAASADGSRPTPPMRPWRRWRRDEGPARLYLWRDLVIVCDVVAWRRGPITRNGEVCQVIGGGPVPVELAQELGKDAF